MRVGFYCESPADRAALAIFTEAILGKPLEPVSMDLEAHSVPGFFQTLDGVFRGVHYNSDAEALVIVVDSDRTEPHDIGHDFQTEQSNCRLCSILQIIARARNQLKPRRGQSELKVAVGLAVPAIEAWCLAGKNKQVGEAAWKVGLQQQRLPFATSQLKQGIYGTNRPAIELEVERLIEEAKRLCAMLETVETLFPAGFGKMAHEIRSWRT